MVRKKKASVEQRIVERVTALRDATRSGKPLADRFTVKTVVLDLAPAEYDSQAVVATRKLLSCSQPMFAAFLGVGVSTVRNWEQGHAPPSDMACRFLDEIRLNPPYWRKRLKDSVRVKSKS